MCGLAFLGSELENSELDLESTIVVLSLESFNTTSLSSNIGVNATEDGARYFRNIGDSVSVEVLLEALVDCPRGTSLPKS